jgi:hypothetical protein
MSGHLFEAMSLTGFSFFSFTFAVLYRHLLRSVAMKKRLSIIFGLLVGAMWTGEVVSGNLGGTAVLGNLRETHPDIYGLAGWLALGAVGMTAVGGFLAGYRSGRTGSALRVGIGSGLISGLITLSALATVIVPFHNEMMKDPSNIREFERGAHDVPSEAELSRFIYSDGLAGGLNHVWIGPLLGITVGGPGGLAGQWLRRSANATRQRRQLTQM